MLVSATTNEAARKKTSLVLNRQASTIDLPFTIFGMVYVCASNCLS